MDLLAQHFIKGDTDTLMAISGGLLGAFYGYEAMQREAKTSENIERLNESIKQRDMVHYDLLESFTS
jgi:ADP-ribosylglycohydrolase